MMMNQMMNPMGGPDPDDAPKGMKWATFIFLIFTFLLALAAMGLGILEFINDESGGDGRLLPFNPMGPKPELLTGSISIYTLKVNKSYYVAIPSQADLLVPNNANKGDSINMFIKTAAQTLGIKTTDDGKNPSAKNNFSKTSYYLSSIGLETYNGGSPAIAKNSEVTAYLIFDGTQWNFKIESINYSNGVAYIP